MKTQIMTISLAALVAMGLPMLADAGPDCSSHAKVKAACCGVCKSDGANKKECCGVCKPEGSCKKECAAKCDAKCTAKGACDMKDASKCAAKGACDMEGAKKSAGTACEADSMKTGGAKEEIAKINTQGLKALLDSGVKVTVLDARSGKYDDGRRIPGAKALAANASEKQIRKAVRKKDYLVVTYCSNLKCPASAMLAERLKELGYENVIKYPEGIQAWTDAGYEVKMTK